MTWDLIVVGAGSAGSALAARSAAQGRRVLLLEAGPDYRPDELPAVLRQPGDRMVLELDSWSEFIYGDLAAARTAAQQPLLYMRGRGLGGSSIINGQIAIRPPREDFDDWALPGWSWDEVLPYFCKLETDVDYGDAPYHGDSGPTPVWRAPRADWGSIDEALAQAAVAAGLGWADDVNAPGAKGVSPYPIASRDFLRVSTADAYLEPARALDTLTIAGGSPVDRVVFEAGRAVGVEVVEPGGGRRVERGDEIVLCAGSIHTPCILMRSGVGPAALLAGLEIDVVADLPVGQSLQDHPMLGLVLPLRPDTSVRTLDDRHTNCCARFDSGDPDGLPYDLMLLSVNWTDPSGGQWPYHPLPGTTDVRHSGTIGVWLNATYSRGSVRIVSQDPAVQPVVAENMLADERDRRRMRHAARVLAGLVESDAVTGICRIDPRQVNAELWDSLDDDAALDRNLLEAVVDTMHGTSTCPIGAVVDPELRVHGVEGLRVADASVFPGVPRTNTNLISIMVGEALADRLN